MIKVLHIIAVPVRVKSANGKIGVNGPERRMANISSLWKENNVDAYFMYPKRGNLYHHFSKEKNKYIDFEIKSKFDFRAIFIIAKHVKSLGIDVIHTHGPGSLDLIAVLAAKLASVKIVVSRPSFIEDLTNLSTYSKLIYKLFDRITYSLVDMMTLVSKNGYDRAPLKNKVIIHNGIDLGKFVPVNHTEHEPIRIVMVAQLKEGKGWHDFIKIIEQLAFAHSVEAHIFGDGILRTELENLIEENNTSHLFNFHGNIENVSQGLKEMDIFLFTSYREGLSVAVLESMAMGLPIVATQVGGIDEQVEQNINGFKHPAGDINGMIISLSKLILSTTMRQSFGTQSRRLAEDKFNESEMIKGYTKLYFELNGK
jgi:glycosyltransferase involved in cell wall biosynthesis